MAGTLRCPENYVPVRLPPLPYKSDTTNWDFPKTTVEESYPYPKKKKPIGKKMCLIYKRAKCIYLNYLLL